ncbi:MAG: DcrB-related protein [Planctomycetota bacterium]
MKFLPPAILVLLLAATSFSDARGPETSTRYLDAANGYSIEPPAFPKVPTGVSCQTVIFFAPQEEGFAPNVNVQVQPWTKSLEEFLALSRSQFKEYDLTLLSEEKRKVSGREAVAFDYEGDMQGRPLRWMALAVADAGRVILVTGTVPKGSFETHEKALRSCLASLQLNGR